MIKRPEIAKWGKKGGYVPPLSSYGKSCERVKSAYEPGYPSASAYFPVSVA